MSSIQIGSVSFPSRCQLIPRTKGCGVRRAYTKGTWAGALLLLEWPMDHQTDGCAMEPTKQLTIMLVTTLLFSKLWWPLEYIGIPLRLWFPVAVHSVCAMAARRTCVRLRGWIERRFTIHQGLSVEGENNVYSGRTMLASGI